MLIARYAITITMYRYNWSLFPARDSVSGSGPSCEPTVLELTYNMERPACVNDHNSRTPYNSKNSSSNCCGKIVIRRTLTVIGNLPLQNSLDLVDIFSTVKADFVRQHNEPESSNIAECEYATRVNFRYAYTV